jgi:hypothetical protein
MDEFWKDLEGRCRDLVEIPFRHLPKGTERSPGRIPLLQSDGIAGVLAWRIRQRQYSPARSAVTSANNLLLVSGLSEMSFICTRNNVGPRRDPGGTPDKMCEAFCVPRYVKYTVLDRKLEGELCCLEC